MLRLLTAATAIVLFVSFEPAPASGQIVVGTATGANCLPFGCSGQLGITAYQQLYLASDFGGSAIDIGALDFFNTFHPGASFDGGTYQLSLSTVTFGLSGFGNSADGNLGANNSVVWSGALSGLVGPMYALDLTNPFYYDPTTMGNLLLDVRVTPNGTGINGYLDREYDGDLSRAMWGANLTSPVDIDPYTVGLVTGFSAVTAVTPEPATMSLLATGLVGLVGFSRRRKRS